MASLAATQFDRWEPDSWLGRYLGLWLALAAYSAWAFLVAPDVYNVLAQGLVFAVAFPLTLWPLYALRRARIEREYAMKMKYQGNSVGRNTGVPSVWFRRASVKFIDLSHPQ